MLDLRAVIERQWYGTPSWLLLLVPLVPVFILISVIRRYWQRRSVEPFAVPVIVVGNLTVGGTGKTPVIMALVRLLAAQGYKPGVIARGYGVSLTSSQVLTETATPSEFGDESVLIARATSCPVAVGSDRRQSVSLLIELGCNVILSDDGLQHYRLHRDIEIAVIDGRRQLGNGWRLPVGPLREGKARLAEVDFVLVNGPQLDSVEQSTQSKRPFHFSLRPVCWRNLSTGQRVELADLSIESAIAIAGIGNPQRFFETLAALGFHGACHSFADHHAFQANDLQEFGANTVLMTEKDAVKCRAFTQPNWWALCVEAQLPECFLQNLNQSLIHLG